MMRPKEKHFIDSSIFLSIIRSDGYEKQANSYLAKVKSNVYHGVVTPLVYGEVLFVIRRDVIEKEQHEATKLFLQLLDNPNIELKISVVERQIKTLNEIKGLEGRIGSIDTQLLSSAIEFDTNYFVTTDKRVGKEVRDRNGRKLLKIKHLDEI